MPKYKDHVRDPDEEMAYESKLKLTQAHQYSIPRDQLKKPRNDPRFVNGVNQWNRCWMYFNEYVQCDQLRQLHDFDNAEKCWDKQKDASTFCVSDHIAKWQKARRAGFWWGHNEPGFEADTIRPRLAHHERYPQHWEK
mmetsp:Transcript_2147/g.2457  ORF Transcript_2147/g.2457 Transcript_2147/m.2457 type:complete len:138 (+) Transcript_2147:25-438(+)|eukprot:CAMPEP_0205822792 /NCGR_PEP_ID=MMETSP0206-20130828/14047_1 /ASSEMBLY_ACC=CAM_ASM_000279 /TAXON_ID=36767 /ORGANISM="Euplotes focardii, Strain TN1" /LENGTH=137 /DNA_ID=CAMNT_0053119361 /DNA_START=25 /DNA_END=438 /DNA_ORIENTATION=-